MAARFRVTSGHDLLSSLANCFSAIRMGQNPQPAGTDSIHTLSRHLGRLDPTCDKGLSGWHFPALTRHISFVQLRAEAAGSPQLIDAATAAATYAQIGSTRVAHSQWQPLWEDLTTRHPEVLD